MSLELSRRPPTAAFADETPCGLKIGYLDSKIFCQSTWAASWFSDLSLNTPLTTNPGVGRFNCGAAISARANFIGDVSSYKKDEFGNFTVIETSSGGVSSWVASSSFPDQLTSADPIPQGCISNSVYAFNDKYSNFVQGGTYNAKMAAWGLYVEVRQHAKIVGEQTLTSGSVFGMEVDVISYGNGATKLYPHGNPSYYNEAGQTYQTERAIGIGLSAGGGNLKAPIGAPQITDNTCAIAISGNGTVENGQYVGAKWKSGIVFTNTALREPEYEAIALCDKYTLNWYKSTNLNAPTPAERNKLCASVSAGSTGNKDQVGLSLTSDNVDGVPLTIGLNRFDSNSFAPQNPTIDLGSKDYKWRDVWAKRVVGEKLILPTTKEGGTIDPDGKPLYPGEFGEIRIVTGSTKRRLYVCFGGTTWGRISVTV